MFYELWPIDWNCGPPPLATGDGLGVDVGEMSEPHANHVDNSSVWIPYVSA
jgi:hypothetical protein